MIFHSVPAPRYPEKNQGPIQCPKCSEAVDSLYEAETGAQAFVSCYDCIQKNPKALQAWIWALERVQHEMETHITGLEEELRLARLSAPEHHELLRRERAALNFLTMDLIRSAQRLGQPGEGHEVQRVETSGGYDCVTVKVYGGMERSSVRRSNLRQAVEALAQQWFGEQWVERMLAWGEVQRYTHLDEAEGHNEWHGPTHKTLKEFEREVDAAFREQGIKRERAEQQVRQLAQALPPEALATAVRRLLAGEATEEDREVAQEWLEAWEYRDEVSLLGGLDLLGLDREEED